jgi:hypothetical protein
VDVFNVVAGAVSIIAFGLALWQFFEARTERERSRERIARQQQQNESALRIATIGVQSSDFMVQRAKDGDVTIKELQAHARNTRGILASLARELYGQRKILEAWKFGKDVTDSLSRDELSKAMEADANRSPDS